MQVIQRKPLIENWIRPYLREGALFITWYQVREGMDWYWDRNTLAANLHHAFAETI